MVDLKMPGPSGLELVRELLRIDAVTRIVVLTGYGSIATAVEAVRLGAVHYLTKPADLDDLLNAFARQEGREGATGSGGWSADLPHEAASLARAEWEHIQRVLMDCQGNVSQAARILGLHRRSLQRKLGKMPQKR